MTLPDPDHLARLNRLRDELRELRHEVRAIGQRPLTYAPPDQLRLAVTRPLAYYAYPGSSGLDKFPIEFVDAHFTAAAGAEIPTQRARGSTAVALALYGGWIPPDSLVIVAQAQGLGPAAAGDWWIVDYARGPFYFQIGSGEALLPGGICPAYLLRSPGGILALVEYSPRVTVYLQEGTTQINGRTVGLNYALPGEIIQGVWRPDSRLFETIGSSGLRRKAVAIADIAPDASGTVTIWANGGATAHTVTAWLDWMHGDESVLADTQIIVEYFRDQGRWVITGAGCGPPSY